MNNAYPKWLEHKNLCKQIQWRKEYKIPVKEIGQLLLVKKKKQQFNQYYKKRIMASDTRPCLSVPYLL